MVSPVDYGIRGYFRVAKFSRFCLKIMGIIFFAVSNFRGRQRPRKIISVLNAFPEQNNEMYVLVVCYLNSESCDIRHFFAIKTTRGVL